jgi:hypothetical protein
MSIYSTQYLAGLVHTMPAPSSFLLDQFFPFVQTHEIEESVFDVKDGSRRIAPFVSPLVEGQVVEAQGYRTEKFKPAYVKPKHVLDNQRPLKRAIGETVGGGMPAASRVELVVMDLLMEQADMVNRRLETMASEVLRTGMVTVSGPKYPTQVVDFGPHAEHTVTLTSTDLWSDSQSDPLGDLKDWRAATLRRGGQAAPVVVMDVDAWEAFIAHAAVQARLDSRRLDAGSLATEQPTDPGGSYMGTIDGMAWAYSEWYIDPADETEKPVLPSGTVILAGPRMSGVRAFGAIRDHDAGFIAAPLWAKSWTDDDPSVRYVMTQSAPLIIPTVPNASLAATAL